MSDPHPSSWQPDSRLNWSDYVPTVSLCVGLLLIAGRPYAGLYVVLIFPILAIWGIVLAWRKRRIVLSTIKLGIWIAATLLLYGLHLIYSKHMRQTADDYVRVISDFKRVHGAYPRDLKTVGKAGFPRQRIFYSRGVEAGQAILYYDDTADPFAKWIYDFSAHRWEFLSD